TLPPCPTLFPYTTLFRSIAGPAPTKYIKDRRIRTLFRDFVPAMFLRDFERFIGVNFQKRNVKNLGGRIARIIGIFGARRNSAGRSEEHTSELQSRENLVC